jgi:hypothetical protein
MLLFISLSTQFGNFWIHASTPFENVAKFEYLRTAVTDQNFNHEEIKNISILVNTCYHSLYSFCLPVLLSKNLKIKTCKTVILPVVLYGYETTSHTSRTT